MSILEAVFHAASGWALAYVLILTALRRWHP